MNTPPRIAVVIGSSRPGRICPGIAAWARDVLADNSRLDYELIDLAEVDLPMLDEPLMAALGHYEHEHTRAWSRRVSGFDGFFFVFPQYNWGYPAIVKNALDYLYDEWHGRPASLLTYGTRGGNLAADQLIQVMRGVDMAVLDVHVEAKVTKADLDENWQLRDLAATLEPTCAQVRAVDEAFTNALTD